MGLKVVSRLRDKGPKTGNDLVGVVQTLVDQNKDLTDAILKQKQLTKAEIQKKVAKAKAVWQAEAKEKRKALLKKLRKLREKKKRLVREKNRLATDLVLQKTRNQKLESENWSMRMSLTEQQTAAANAAALREQAVETQPTPGVGQVYSILL